MLKCNVKFRGGKVAKFSYIKNAFELDKTMNFRMLTKLKPADFNFSDSYLKMKVRVAAAQLSNTMASSIEHFVVSNALPSEAIFTPEFAHIIDCLFDSITHRLRIIQKGNLLNVV